MKILLDLQGAQTQSRRRGIGRFTREVTRALLRQPHDHELHLALSAPLDQAIDELIAEFRPCVPPDRFHYLRLPYATSAHVPSNAWRSQAASRLFRHAIDRIDPDLVWHHSVFEGYDEDAVMPDIGTSAARAATLYDLIPLHDPQTHLSGTLVKSWYQHRTGLLAEADMLFSISQWSADDAIARLGLDPARIAVIGAGVDTLFRPARLDPQARNALLGRLGIHAPFVLYNGGMDPRKNVAALLEAFVRLPAEIRRGHQLVLVGEDGEVRAQLTRLSQRIGLAAHELVFTGRVDDADLIALYSECALFVFPSRLEGFGLPVLEAMACGAPTLCSNATSLPEVAGRDDILFPPDDRDALCARMLAVLSEPEFARELQAYGPRRAADFSWDAVAERTLAAIDTLPQQRRRPQIARGDSALTPTKQVIADLATITATPSRDDLAQAAFSLSMLRPSPHPPQWLVDVSSIASADIGTGTHRVTRSILGQWLRQPPAGIKIAPVRFQDGHYHYARQFAAQLLGATTTDGADGIATAYPGDVFVGLDWAPEALNASRARVQEWRRGQVASCFVVHDLLPLQMPARFHPYSCELFERWLHNVAQLADGIACVSATTATELEAWLDRTPIEYPFRRRPEVAAFTLGASFAAAATTASIRPPVAAALRARPSLLLVGTLEPRKGHDHALRICEHLWRHGHDVNLVVVGHRGWSDAALVERLSRHPQSGQRLFWLDDAEDAELSALYRDCTVLLALSEGEGYGLPLLEAAHHGLPILARSLAVFREIMADYPQYLDNAAPSTWPSVVAEWLNAPPRKSAATFVAPSWADSAEMLAARIAGFVSRSSAPRNTADADLSRHG